MDFNGLNPIIEAYQSMYLTESSSDVLRRYKIPKDLIASNQPHLLSIRLPDSNASDSIDPNIAKLIADLRSGKFRPKFMTSFRILDGYVRDNSVVMMFATKASGSIPKKLFHWTRAENVESILKTGLRPSRGDWQIGKSAAGTSEVTYEAVFLIEKFGALSKNRGFEAFKRPGYQLIEVNDVSRLNLYKDPHFYMPDPNSFMVYETIPANMLSLKEK
jgi:hypothetical protein